MSSLSLHECADCGREHYTKTGARLCDCPAKERRAFDSDGDLCNNAVTHDHFLADLVNPDSKRAEDKVRLTMRTFVTTGQRTISNLVRDVFGYRADEQLTGSNASTEATNDYMLAYRLYTQNPDYFRTADQNSGTAVEPTPNLVDLITEGVSQNPDEPLGNRDFSLDLLGNVDELAEEHKEHLETAFTSYLDRIDKYRIYLEARDGFARPGGRDYLRCDYKTRFNDVGRVKRQFAKFKRALEVAPLLCHDLDDVLEAAVGLGDDLDLDFDTDDLRNADDLLAFSDDLDELDSDDLDDLLARLPDRAPKGAAMVTVTTNPANFDSLKDSIEQMNPDHNRLQSWLATQPSTKADGRHRWEGRLPYIKAFEFTKDGKPHLHLLFFGVPRRPEDGKPWLVDKNALVGYCRHNLGRCRIVDLEPLEYRNDLGDRYEPDSGFVSPYDVHNSSRDEIQEGQTAGQYLGKYLSATFGGILSMHDRGSEYLDELHDDDLDLDDDRDDALAEFVDDYLEDDSAPYEDKTERHRLALYWATGTSILSFSKDLEDLALIDDNEDWRVAFEYVGTFHIDDTPTELLANSVPLDFLELKDDDQLPDLSRGDRPPPRLGEGFTTRERLEGATSKSDSR